MLDRYLPDFVTRLRPGFFCGRLGYLLALLLGLLPTLALAATPAAEPLPSETIAVTKLTFAGTASELATELGGLLRDTLRRSGYTVMAPEVVDNRLANEQRLLGCTTPSCYNRLAQVLGVRRVVEGEVQRLELQTFTVKLSLRDLFSGGLVTPPVQQGCQVCSNDELHQVVVRTTAQLAKVAPPTGPQDTYRPTASGILDVDTDPAGAQLRIDQQSRNERSPASLLLAAGVHELVVTGTGYRPLRRSVEILPDQHLPLHLMLTPTPQHRPWLTAVSWVSVAVAVGLVVGAGLLLHYDGTPVTTADCPNQPGMNFHCPTQYATRGLGVAAAVGAGLFAVGAGVGFYFDNAAPTRRPILSK